MTLKDHLIETGTDGELDGTSEADINRMMKRLQGEDKIIIHLHGGLVSKRKAVKAASALRTEYVSAGAYPVFFVYRTGILEIIGNNLHEISKEPIFKKLVKKLLKYAVGKLGTPGGSKSVGGLDLPRDLKVAIEYKGLERNEEPFEAVDIAKGVGELTDEEERQLIDDLATDVEFQEEVQAIVDGATDDQEKVLQGAKGITVSHRTSSKTMMSAHVVYELKENALQKDGKGVFSTATLLVRVGLVLKRIIHRFIKRRDHGLHATVVEELLRELYLDNIGSAVWNLMKKETEDTFARVPSGEPTRGGRYFVDMLGEMIKSREPYPEVTIVGHSLGSVFTCNLIGDIDRARKDKTHPLPRDFVIENVIFHAPAVEFKVFANTLRKHKAAFSNFRMFSLGDKLESDYWEVPLLYPRSLLYFVSGAFEETDQGKGAFDRPLVGMERYTKRHNVYKMADVKTVRKFLQEDANRTVWSLATGKPGRESDAVKHGAFNETVGARATLDSVLHILRNGM